MAINTALIEMAGVYYVAYQLSAHGYTVALTPDRTKAFDLVVLNPESAKSVPVQVKAAMNPGRYSSKKSYRSNENYRAWTAGKKMFDLKLKSPAFVILVDLGGRPLEPKEPTVAYVIPWGTWEQDTDLIYQSGTSYWLNMLARHEIEFRESWDRIKEAIE